MTEPAQPVAPAAPDGTEPAGDPTWSAPLRPPLDIPQAGVSPVPPPPPKRRPWVAPTLFAATCVTTFLAGAVWSFFARQWWQGMVDGMLFMLAVMTILLTHELGHYLQARRYRVRTSLPLFLPFIPPFGTLGALIIMRQRIPDRRALFDIGITGPLAGLVPTLAVLVWGTARAEVRPIGDQGGGLFLGEPLLSQWIATWIHGPIPDGSTLFIGPVGMAGWLGLFVTALNLVPIGQLDGGHVLYALIRRRAHLVATALLGLAIAYVVVNQVWNWTLMLVLLLLIGPRHPPTMNDTVPLGPVRVVLGWLTLAFLLIGFTPVPIAWGP